MDAAQTCIITPEAIEVLVMRPSVSCCVGVGVMGGAVACAPVPGRRFSRIHFSSEVWLVGVENSTRARAT